MKIKGKGGGRGKGIKHTEKEMKVRSTEDNAFYTDSYSLCYN